MPCVVWNWFTNKLSEDVRPLGNVVVVDPDGERLELAREKYYIR